MTSSRPRLFRTWIIASVLWLGFCFTVTPLGCKLINATAYCSGYNWEKPAIYAAAPFVVLIVAYVVAWIGRQFAK